ncbi:helix-turn-helix domain-containing protein [uncultured Pseudoalteromonas sp.]|uniref:helix-turn-helix transcriptional regulator n=1 Tax=uncultured Pseudoalteromonas sp. TaxID=114053 RepID=UPI002591F2D5|nr:helix-turn-helix domain-containing protein [uncultured Pseudoalteromonas sp.]
MSLPTSQYLATKDVAALFGVKSKTILEWEKDGKFPPATIIGKPKRWDTQVVDKHRQSLREQATRLSA